MAASSASERPAPVLPVGTASSNGSRRPQNSSGGVFPIGQRGSSATSSALASVTEQSAGRRGGQNAWDALPRDGTEILHWALPGVALLGGLLVENVGLYFGTRSYVHWMDELHSPWQGPGGVAAARGVQGSLEGDQASAAFVTVQLASSVLETMTDMLPVAWCALVLRSGNLRLWSQTLFAAALLMTLKGFLSWSTVVPDDAGWEVCQERLGVDGLRYYRREVVYFRELLPDVLLLEVRGLWAGKPLRRRYCADAMFCSSTCLCTIFCTSFCEAAFMAIAPLVQAVEWHATVRAAVRCVLCLLVIGNAVLPVLQGYHRAADVLIGIALPFLVYCNPALAVAARHWSQGEHVEEEDWPPLPIDSGSPVPTSPTTPGSSVALLSGMRLAASEDGDSEQVAQEMGKVLLMPPWCAAHTYLYLRSEPVTNVALPEQQELLNRQLAHLRQAQEQLTRRVHKREDALKKEIADELLGTQRAQALAEQRMKEALSDQRRMLAARAKRHLFKTS